MVQQHYCEDKKRSDHSGPYGAPGHWAPGLLLTVFPDELIIRLAFQHLPAQQVDKVSLLQTNPLVAARWEVHHGGRCQYEIVLPQEDGRRLGTDQLLPAGYLWRHFTCRQFHLVQWLADEVAPDPPVDQHRQLSAGNVGSGEEREAVVVTVRIEHIIAVAQLQPIEARQGVHQFAVACLEPLALMKQCPADMPNQPPAQRLRHGVGTRFAWQLVTSLQL